MVGKFSVMSFMYMRNNVGDRTFQYRTHCCNIIFSGLSFYFCPCSYVFKVMANPSVHFFHACIFAVLLSVPPSIINQIHFLSLPKPLVCFCSLWWYLPFAELYRLFDIHCICTFWILLLSEVQRCIYSDTIIATPLFWHLLWNHLGQTELKYRY